MGIHFIHFEFGFTRDEWLFIFHLYKALILLYLLSGGWSTQDPNNIEVRKAARYATSVSYPTGTISSNVVTAKSQVVAGNTYDLNVAVTFIGNKSCSMQNYVVWKVGDPKAPTPYKLASKKALTSQLCPRH